MLKLKELYIAAAGRLVEPQKIDFSVLGNMVQVDGDNKNTDGSSGAGKSTIFNSLDYLFGINDIPNNVLQSRLTKNGMDVKGVFDYDGKKLIVQRSKSGGLSIDLEGEAPFSGNNALAEERLDRIIAMPRDLFRPMLHKRQKEGGFFLDFTPKDMNTFLTDCLNLTESRKKSELLDNRLKELLGSKDTPGLKGTLESSLLSSESSLKATQDAILSLGLAPIKDIHEEIVTELYKKAETSHQNVLYTQELHKTQLAELAKTRPQYKSIAYDKSTLYKYEEGLTIVKKRSQDAIMSEMRRQAEVQKQISDLTTSDYKRRAEIRTQIADLNASHNKLQNTIDAARRASVEATNLATEIKKIRDAICPTCEQSWVTETAKARENEKIEQLKALKDTIQNGNLATAEIAQTTLAIGELTKQLEEKPNPQMAELNLQLAPRPLPEVEEMKEAQRRLEGLIYQEKVKEQAHADTETANNRAVMDAYAAQEKELRARQAAELNQAQGQYGLDSKVYEAAAARLRAYNDAQKRYSDTLTSLKAQESVYINKSVKDKEELAKVLDEITYNEEAKKAVKSFLSCSFDEALESISETATRIVRSIPTMADATVRLEGTRETKDGKVKEEVTAVIDNGGELNIPIKSLCGGERSSVDLAVDLAVIDLIEQKTGKGIDVFILDEPFTGLDSICIEMALEVLKNSNISKKLIIVDHNPEVKQMVQSRLVVVREGATSSIVQS